MKFKVVVMAGIFSLLTCFLTFPCFASELSTIEGDTILPPVEKVFPTIKNSYNSKDLTMASEIGITCANEIILKSLIAKDSSIFTTENIRNCVKNYFKAAEWEYDL